MAEVEPLEAKIIKQVEYYFGDLNLSRDKFMKETMAENDGWISLDTMLKFNRLKLLCDNIDVINKALSKSKSGLLELGPKGIRRNPNSTVPETVDEALAMYKDRSVYVKGFDAKTTLDEIIEWLEFYGGKTLNVHMRRTLKDKKFKGSVFAVFETKEDADKFLSSPKAAAYQGNSVIRMLREDYWKGKKEGKIAKIEAQAIKRAAAEADQDAKVISRMTVGALLELSGLPVKTETGASKEGSEAVENEDAENIDVKADVPSEVTEDEKKRSPTDQTDEPTDSLTILALKEWLSKKIDSGNSVAWVDMQPAEGKAIVRFKIQNGAARGWEAVQTAFEGKPVIYANCELSGRVLSGDEEKKHWKTIFAAQLHKAQKRHGSLNGRRGSNKRRRMN